MKCQKNTENADDKKYYSNDDDYDDDDDADYDKIIRIVIIAGALYRAVEREDQYEALFL